MRLIDLRHAIPQLRYHAANIPSTITAAQSIEHPIRYLEDFSITCCFAHIEMWNSFPTTPLICLEQIDDFLHVTRH